MDQLKPDNPAEPPQAPAGDFPEWCDLSCRWAAFPDQDALDGAGSCRTFAALHCRLLGRPVTKNARCAARRSGDQTNIISQYP